MLTLLSECHFWTMRDDIRIKHTDYGAFRYMRNRELPNQTSGNDIYAEAKRNYIESRNGVAILKKSRKAIGRLKENLKRMEELIRSHKIVHIHWAEAAHVVLLFANGIIAHVCIDVFTGDISRMVYEKYLVGKMAADTVADAFFTRSHIVLTYNTNQVTVIHLQKPNTRSQGPEKISNMEPKMFHAIIPGTAERKLPRRISVNNSHDMFVIWTKSSQNEVFPWRPTIRDQDRANIHVFKLKGNQLDFFAFCWSENDPLFVDFLRSSDNQILTLEQKISRKGEISAEVCTYEIIVGKMQRTPLSSIPVGTQITCFALSPDQEKLLLGSADRNICLHDLVLQTTKCATQIDIIPIQCSWHCDSSLIMIANTRSQFQCFDLALTPIGNQLQSEDVTPTNLLDLSHYFATHPTLVQVSFSRKPDLKHHSLPYATTDCFLLLLYDQGPIGCLRFFAGAGMLGDIHNSGLTADVILDKYLALNQLERAVNLLNALNWETYGAICLISLHKIANYVFYRGEHKPARIELMARALKTFSESLSEETKDEFSDQVFDLKRRFFFFLLRRNLFVEAFEVAQDIEDYDLFMDLFNITKCDSNLVEFAAACFSQAAAILHDEELVNANDCRSESGCSQSSTSDIPPTCPSKLQKQQQQHQKFLKHYVPPLPSFKSKVFNAEMIKINIPKPELRVETDREKSRPPPPPVPAKKQTRLNSTTMALINSPALKSNLASLTLKTQKCIKDVSSSFPAPAHWTDLDVSLKSSNFKSAFVPHYKSSTTDSVDHCKREITSPNAIPLATPPSSDYLHLASPAVVTDNHIPANSSCVSDTLPTVQRNYVTPPQSLPIVPVNIYQPKFFQHPLVSGTIPPSTPAITSLAAHSISNEEYQKVLLSKKPTASILSNSSTAQNGSNASVLSGSSGPNGHFHKEASGKNMNGEKNKVKFSDTVQVAVVPEIPRKDKPLMSKRNGYVRPPQRNFTNPKKELQDSLPLCHPNDDYLKDFNPLPTAISQKHTSKDEASQKLLQAAAHKSYNNNKTVNSNMNKTSSSSSSTPTASNGTTSAMKVVHFGVV